MLLFKVHETHILCLPTGGLSGIRLGVESVCSKCGTKFHSSSETTDVCPECLKNEFAAAPELEAGERMTNSEEFRRASKRQRSRAARMQRDLQENALFNVSGKMRCAIGVVIFLGCMYLFLLGDSPTYSTPISRLDMDSQRFISVGLCWIAAGLVFFSFKRHKLLVSIVGLGMMAIGWFAPEIWRYKPVAPLPDEQPKTEQKAPSKQPEPEPEQMRKPGAVMTSGDLEVFYESRSKTPHMAHYAVYMDQQNSASRGIIRDALTRLLEAEYTRAYTRGQGALFVVTNSRGQLRNISRLLSRFGRVSYAKPEDGIYEVRFMPDHSNMVCRYGSDVLTNPHNPAFVQANLSEITCLDPLRVRTAAQILKNADVPALRKDIHATLLRVLKEPWQNEEDTHRELIETLVVYAPAGDKNTIDYCLRYFQNCRARRQPTSAIVMLRLIKEVPDVMVGPVVEMWSVNPVAWSGVLASLGGQAEDEIIKLLSATDKIQLINTILNYLGEYGTEKSVPAVEKLLRHPDSIISHSAKNTLDMLMQRQ